MWKEAYRCPSHAACKRGTYQRSHTGLLGRQMWHQKSNALAAGTHSIWGSRNNARQGSVGRPQHKSARMATRQAHILSSSTAEEQPPPPRENNRNRHEPYLQHTDGRPIRGQLCAGGRLNLCQRLPDAAVVPMVSLHSSSKQYEAANSSSFGVAVSNCSSPCQGGGWSQISDPVALHKRLLMLLRERCFLCLRPPNATQISTGGCRMRLLLPTGGCWMQSKSLPEARLMSATVKFQKHRKQHPLLFRQGIVLAGGGGVRHKGLQGEGGGGLQTRASTAAAPCPSHRGSPVMHSLPWCASRCSTSGSANQEWPAQSRCGSSRLSAPKPPSHSPRCPRYHSFRPASISSYVRPSFDRRNRPQTSCNLQEVGGGCWRHWRPPMGG